MAPTTLTQSALSLAPRELPAVDGPAPAFLAPPKSESAPLQADRFERATPGSPTSDLAAGYATLIHGQSSGARELSAASGGLGGALALMAGTAALIPGQHELAMGLAAAASVAGATSSVADYVDHRSIRSDVNLANNTLKDRAIDAGLLAGALSAGAAVASLFPTLGHVAEGLAELAGGAALLDGAISVYDHRVNDNGFTPSAGLNAKTFGTATKGLYGLGGALAGVLANVPGAQFVQGVLQGLSGLANAYHSVRVEASLPHATPAPSSDVSTTA